MNNCAICGEPIYPTVAGVLVHGHGAPECGTGDGSVATSHQLSEAEAFFYENAGYAYDPATETPEQGRVRGARALAQAEIWLTEHDLEVQWEDDPDGQDFDRGTEYADLPHYAATLEDDNGTVLSSLSGVMFADGGEPWGDPYARVVAAELALEAMDEVVGRP